METNSTPKPYDPPLKITIPLPSEIPRARGINATTDSYGGNLRVRCTNYEYNIIEAEAHNLGLTIAGFGRCVMRSVAQALKEHREHGSSSISVELSTDVRDVKTGGIGSIIRE